VNLEWWRKNADRRLISGLPASLLLGSPLAVPTHGKAMALSFREPPLEFNIFLHETRWRGACENGIMRARAIL
jgi:hypothetical protein